MAEERKSISLDRRRRSSRGLSSARDLLRGIPSDIPQHERLLILLRKCYFATVKKLQQEEDLSPHLATALSTEGHHMFEEGGIISKLAVLATDPANQAEEDIVKYNEDLKNLVQESQKWEELLANGMPLHDTANTPKDVQWESYDYKALFDHVTECERQVQTCLENVTKLSEILSDEVVSSAVRHPEEHLRHLASFVEDDTRELCKQILKKE